MPGQCAYIKLTTTRNLSIRLVSFLYYRLHYSLLNAQINLRDHFLNRDIQLKAYWPDIHYSFMNSSKTDKEGIWMPSLQERLAENPFVAYKPLDISSVNFIMLGLMLAQSDQSVRKTRALLVGCPSPNWPGL